MKMHFPDGPTTLFEDAHIAFIRTGAFKTPFESKEGQPFRPTLQQHVGHALVKGIEFLAESITAHRLIRIWKERSLRIEDDSPLIKQLTKLFNQMELSLPSNPA